VGISKIFPVEFSTGISFSHMNRVLYCVLLCNVIVKYNRRFSTVLHESWSKHTVVCYGVACLVFREQTLDCPVRSVCLPHQKKSPCYGLALGVAA
jgi:hypothetical protein